MGYTYGLASIYISPIAVDGGAGTEFVLFGKTNPGTTKIATDKGTKTEKYCEETSDPLVSIPGKRITTLETQLIVEGTDTLLKALGGSVTGNIWSAPDNVPVIEKTVKVEFLAGGETVFTRASLDASINATVSREGDLFYVDCTFTVLQPTKAGEPKQTFKQI